MIVVDTSALIAILLLESDAEAYSKRLQAASEPRVSVANVLEALMVLFGRTGLDLRGDVEDLLAKAGARKEPVTPEQLALAWDAFWRFGKGRNAARLNYGDCFAYALAKELDLPLLFKGNDFPQTDIRPAL